MLQSKILAFGQALFTPRSRVEYFYDG